MHVVVGGVVEKEGKFLLVQEAKEKCYGKWNIPAGHLDFGESITEGAKREIKEETGCDVELTGIVNVANRRMEDDILVIAVFATKLLKEEIVYDKNEILDVKWFSYDEIMNKMDNQLRDLNFIKKSIENYHNNIIGDMRIINVL